MGLFTGMKPGSLKWKKFMGKLYGWGASVVILGALFKIQHYPGAGPMLILGLSTEAVIFFFSAFEPVHQEPDWTLVYPELAVPEEGDEGLLSVGEDALEDDETITEQLDRMLEEAKIGPELIESLGAGLRGLTEQTSKLSNIADTTVATDEFVSKIKDASRSAGDLSEVYAKTASSLSSSASQMADSYEQTAQELSSSASQLSQTYARTAEQLRGELEISSEEGSNYREQLQKFTTNLSALNNAYEMQLKGTQETQKFYDGVSELVQNLNDSIDDTKKYKENMAGLATNLNALNTVYGNMLTAMSGVAASNRDA